MIDTDKYEGHTEGTWAWERGALNVLHVKDSEPMHTLLHDEKKDVDAQLIADAPLLLAEVKRYRLKDCAITQAEHMRAQVGDNTWHYAMEVWLYPETHYWDYDEEGTVQLIERYITTNRDAWVKYWGEPSEVARKRCEE